MVQLIQFLINIFLVNAVFMLSFLFRYGVDIPEANFTPYKNNFAFLTCIYMLSLTSCGVLNRRFSSYWQLFDKIAKSFFFGSLFGITLVYVFRTQWSGFPSSIFVISVPLGILIVFTFNSLILRLAGRIKKKVVIIGKENDFDVFGKSSLTEKKHLDSIEQLLDYEDVDEVVICEHIHEDHHLNLLIY